MNYVFQFGTVWPEADKLLLGTWFTLRLSTLAMVLGLAVGVLGALGKASSSRWVRGLVHGYVEAVRNTPFLVQLLLLYLGLPSLGLRLHAGPGRTAGDGRQSRRLRDRDRARRHRGGAAGQIEAGRALGLRPHQIFRFVVLVPALRTVFPALGSQFILVMLASSVVSVISAEELTAVADTIIARNFRSFEFYFVVTGHLSGAVAGLPGRLRRDRPLAVPPLERARVIREFTFGEAMFLVAAVRWTVLLAALAFVGGSIVGLIFAVLRVSKGKLPRARRDRLHQALPGHAAPDAALSRLFRRQSFWACRPMPGWPRRWDSRSIPAPSWPRSGAAASRPFRAANGTAHGRSRSAHCCSSASSSCRRRCASPSRRRWASWCRC